MFGVVVAILFILVLTGEAAAQVVADSSTKSLFSIYIERSHLIEQGLIGIAKKLFWHFAIIEIFIVGATVVVRKDDLGPLLQTVGVLLFWGSF